MGFSRRKRGPTRWAAILGVTLLAGQLACSAIGNLFPPTPPVPGIVFANGKYLASPYDLKVVNGDIQLNGEVIRPLPTLPAPTVPPPPPSDPQTADELVDVAAAKFESMHIGTQSDVTADVRAQIVGLVKSFPSAAQVEDLGSAIAVTDKTGARAVLDLTWETPPTAAQLLALQEGRAREWRDLLDSGGALFISTSTVVEVPSGNVATVFAGIRSAFQLPEDQRSAQLERLTGAASIGEALRAAGPPPADVERGLPTAVPPPPLVPATQTPISEAGSGLMAPRPVAQRTTDCCFNTPAAHNAYFFLTLNWEDTSPQTKAVRLHGYNVITYEGSTLGAGDSTVDNFLRSSGQAGVLIINAHGFEDGIAIEQYFAESDRDKAKARYKAMGIPVDTGAAYEAGTGWRDYTIEIDTRTIAMWKGAQSVVELGSCDTFPLAQAFIDQGARDFIAPDKPVNAAASDPFNAEFWGRMSGVIGQGTERSIIQAWADTESVHGPYKHQGSSLTVLSPGVLRVLPAEGSTVLAGLPVQASVEFDSQMNTVWYPVFETMQGCGNPYIPLGLSHWTDPRHFVFQFTPTQPGELEIRVTSYSSLSQNDSDIVLDGNLQPAGSNHEGPNGDSYVWHLKCVMASEDEIRRALSASPTASLTDVPTPTRTEAPTHTETATKTETPSATPTLTRTPKPYRDPGHEIAGGSIPKTGPSNTPTATETPTEGFEIPIIPIPGFGATSTPTATPWWMGYLPRLPWPMWWQTATPGPVTETIPTYTPTATETETELPEGLDIPVIPVPNFGASYTPTPTSTSTATATPKENAQLRGTVNQRSNARYGPGSVFLYLYGLAAGTKMEVIGRDVGDHWLEIRAIGGHNPAWINAGLISVDGDTTSLPIVDSDELLSISDKFPAPNVTFTSMDPDQVVVKWSPVGVPETWIPDDGLPTYVLELWGCDKGGDTFKALGTRETELEFPNDSTCGYPRAELRLQTKDGFSKAVVVKFKK